MGVTGFTNKFKVGDRVKSVHECYYGGTMVLPAGSIGVVVDVVTSDPWPYAVVFDDDPFEGCCGEKELDFA